MKKILVPLILLAIILGMLLPYGAAFKDVIPYNLGILLFFSFYAVNFKIKDFLQKEMLFYALFVLILIPAVLFFCTPRLNPSFRIGLFLIALSPPAIAGSITVRFLNGDLKFAVIATVFYNLLAPVSYSLLTNLFFHSAGIKISVLNIFSNLFFLLFIPFCLAEIAKKIEKLKPVLQKLSGPSSLLFPLSIYIAISYSSYKIKALALPELISVLGVTFLIALILYVIGFLSGADPGRKKALAIAMGQKNTALCIWVGLANFDPLTVIPATFYIIVHHTINTVLLILSPRLNKPQQTGEHPEQ